MGLGPGKQNKARRFKGGGPRPDRNEAKRSDARARQEAAASVTPQQRRTELDRRLGKGMGATRERAKLAKALRGAA